MKQGDGVKPNIFNTSLVFVIRQVSVQAQATIFYKSLRVRGYADDIMIIGRRKRTISEVCEELKERENEVGLNINVEKTKEKNGRK